MDNTCKNRKIIHVDMDAFYASVEQNDQPKYRGKPVVVAWKSNRSVVCAASYEARKYGIRSAMPYTEAKRKCSSLINIPPNFARYRQVSNEINKVFRSYTNIVEKLSLDEAYLDVTKALTDIATATAIAKQIKIDIKKSTGLTASAGVAPNKFLAKIASDWNKPDGIYVIKPHQIDSFLKKLPLRKIMGVGIATEKKLNALNITTMAGLQNCSVNFLISHFGKFGFRLYHLARGQDDSPVRSERPRKSLSKETTFGSDLSLEEIKNSAPELISETWKELQKTGEIPKTFSIKIKTTEFKTMSRQVAIDPSFLELKHLEKIVSQLLTQFNQPAHTKYRLLGMCFSNFKLNHQLDQNQLF